MSMTTKDFENVAKNFVVKKVKEVAGIEVSKKEIQTVFFAYTLGNVKGTFYALKMEKYYAEVTFDRFRDQMYVDLYQKVSNDVYKPEEFKYGD